MKAKLPKKLMMPLIAGLLAFTAIAPTVAYAGNSSDTEFYATVPMGQTKSIDVRQKTNESSVYAKVDFRTDYHMMWPVAAVANHGGNDYQTVDIGAQHWQCIAGKGTFMPGLIYEKGYRYASIWFENVSSRYSTAVSGVWSPDSVGDPYSKY